MACTGLRCPNSPLAILAMTLVICVVSSICFLRFYWEKRVTLISQYHQHYHNLNIPSWSYVEVRTVPDEPDVWPFRVFKTAPWNPPNLTVTIYEASNYAHGLLFFSPSNRTKHSMKQSAPFLMDPVANELVFGFNETEQRTNNVRMQMINDEPRLTFWSGQTVMGHGYGEFVLLDWEYSKSTLGLGNVYNFQKKNIDKNKAAKIPGPADYHELQATSRNSIIVTAYNSTREDLRHMGGREKGWVSDSQFYEIDVNTGEVIFEWSAMEHIPRNASQLPITSYMGDGSASRPYDFFHINSVQRIGNHYLVSSRHMFAFYMVSGEDGHIIWELSGRGQGGNFGPLPREHRFSWAHHARAFNVTDRSMIVSLYDNHMNKENVTETGSRGLMFEVELPPDPEKTPKLLRNLHVEDKEYFSDSQGSYQAELHNGNQLMSYGPIPVVREFGPHWAGSPLLWEVRFGLDNGAQNYRAGKYDWHGTPAAWDPSLVVETNGRKLTGYVSWNGATHVVSWTVYSSDSNGNKMEPVGRMARKGFETVFELEQKDISCLQIGANQHGKEVRMSNKICRDEMANAGPST